MKYLMVSLYVALLALTACNRPQNNDVGASAVAVRQTNLYMDALMAGNFDTAWKYYSPEFFKTQTDEGWRNNLTEIQKKRGKMVRYEVSDQQMDMRYSGRFFIVIYRVWYENSQKSSRQIVTMIEPVTGGSGLKIYAHNIHFDDVQVQ